jgi:hypothetical protein
MIKHFCLAFCAVSVFQNPSGDKVCYVREFQTKSDAQQMCIDNGFSGLIEARSVEDMLFTSRLECCNTNLPQSSTQS